MFPRPTFPPYLLGFAYLMSRTTVRKLLAAAREVPYIPLEDVYVTGLLAERAGVESVHHPGFHTYIREQKMRGPQIAACAAGEVTVHHVRPDMMTKCHNASQAGAGRGAKDVRANKITY